MAIILTGVKECIAGLRKIQAQQSAATRAGLLKAAYLLEREIKTSLSITSATGEEKRDSRGRFASRGSTSSAPGSPPFLRSGDLRRSIQVEEPTPEGLGRWSTRVGPTAIYGRIQELGGTAGRGAVLPARPYVEPALVKMKPVMAVEIKKAWQEGQAL